jgi:shikimate dehydrogenase
MARKLGIFGYPIGHSLSPVFQQAALDHHEIDARYEAWETSPADLGAAVARLRGCEFLGANVTVPHKVEVMAHLDEIDELARLIGAVNTIVKRGERLTGHNTDAGGFVDSLRQAGGFDPKGRRALLLGAGGAARAAAFALVRGGASELVIANRTLDRATALAAELGGACRGVSAIRLADAASLGEAAAGADLVVNSTTVGMRHTTEQDASPLPSGTLASGSVVYDMVYNPARTPLLAQAELAGATAVGGLSMLIHQGAAAFELWTGKRAPLQVMFAAAERAMVKWS